MGEPNINLESIESNADKKSAGEKPDGDSGACNNNCENGESNTPGDAVDVQRQ